MANRYGKGRVVVVVFDISFGGMDEGCLVMLDPVFQTSDAVLEADFLFGILLIAAFERGGQPFGNVGDQDEAHVVGSFDNLECSAWRERRGLEGRVGAHILEEVVADLFACGDHGRREVLRVRDLNRGGCGSS